MRQSEGVSKADRRGGAGRCDCAAIVRRLGLTAHPEGGWYREVHRSAASVGVPPGYPGARCALTVIHFLLDKGGFSAFHRVRSEEVWVHLDGAPIELALLEVQPVLRRLGPVTSGADPLVVVPPDVLQAARPCGGWSLAACLVAPGFEFADFMMPPREELLRAYPDHRDLVLRLTRP